MKHEPIQGVAPWHPMGCRCQSCDPRGPAAGGYPLLHAALAMAAGFAFTAAAIGMFS